MTDWLPALLGSGAIARLHLHVETAHLSPAKTTKTIVVEPDHTVAEAIDAGADNHIRLQGEGFCARIRGGGERSAWKPRVCRCV